jgi:hypothetical protein
LACFEKHEHDNRNVSSLQQEKIKINKSATDARGLCRQDQIIAANDFLSSVRHGAFAEKVKEFPQRRHAA